MKSKLLDFFHIEFFFLRSYGPCEVGRHIRKCLEKNEMVSGLFFERRVWYCCSTRGTQSAVFWFFAARVRVGVHLLR